MVRAGRPWFLAEVQHAQTALKGSLRHFPAQTQAPFVFPVAIEADDVDVDCCTTPRGPVVVPARTVLAQVPPPGIAFCVALTRSTVDLGDAPCAMIGGFMRGHDCPDAWPWAAATLPAAIKGHLRL